MGTTYAAIVADVIFCSYEADFVYIHLLKMDRS